MRIALAGARTYPARHGGIEVAVAEIASELSKMGHEVHVFVSSDDQAMASADPGLSVWRSAAIPGKYTHSISQSFLSIRGIRAVRPDVVHIHGVGPSIPLALTSRIFGSSVPSVVTIHGIDWRRQKWSRGAARAFEMAATRGLKNATSVTAVSTADARTIAAKLQIPVRVIGNGTSLPSTSNSSAVLAALSLPPEYSIALSRVTPEKNFEELIDQYDRNVAEEFGPLIIVGGGAGSYSERYFERLRDSAPDWVKFLGELDRSDAMAALAHAARFISFSKLEGAPLTVLEARSFGIPLFLSPIEGHREVAGASATYVESGKPGALASALHEACLHSRSTVIAPPEPVGRGWSTVAKSYEAEYRHALGYSVHARSIEVVLP